MSDIVKVKATQPIIEPTRKYKIGEVFDTSPKRAKRFEEVGVAKIVTEKEVEAPPKDKIAKGDKTKKK